MPEMEEKTLHRLQTASNSNFVRATNGSSADSSQTSSSSGYRRSSIDLPSRPLATDFTTKQQLRLRAGDVRLARMQISLAQLQDEMRQSSKLLAKLCQAAELEISQDKHMTQSLIKPGEMLDLRN